MTGIREQRRAELRRRGTAAADIDSLLAFDAPLGDTSAPPTDLPLADEPLVRDWTDYVRTAREHGSWTALKQALLPFSFPIRAGMSEDPTYRASTRRGHPPPVGAPPLELEAADALELDLHASVAGRIPVLRVASRVDFVRIVQALVGRNEPIEVPDSMGACTVAGLNNWDRVRRRRREWEEAQGGPQPDSAWAAEFKNLIPRREQYQDRILVLSDGPYSGVAASALDLDEATWRGHSLRIRTEHECTHYFTKRAFGAMRKNLLDELVCDYAGIVAAVGHFELDWLLHFMGLDAYPRYREGARLENYRGSPPIPDTALPVVRGLVFDAARNLKAFDDTLGPADRGLRRWTAILWTLCTLSLEELAMPDGADRMRRAYQ